MAESYTYTQTSLTGYSVHLPGLAEAKNLDALRALKNYADTKTREINEANAQSMFESARKHPMLGKSLALLFRVDGETLPRIDGMEELNFHHISIELYEILRPRITSLSSRYWADAGKSIARYIEHDINFDHYFNRPDGAPWSNIPNLICLIGHEVTRFFRGEPVKL